MAPSPLRDSVKYGLAVPAAGVVGMASVNALEWRLANIGPCVIAETLLSSRRTFFCVLALLLLPSSGKKVQPKASARKFYLTFATVLRALIGVAISSVCFVCPRQRRMLAAIAAVTLVLLALRHRYVRARPALQSGKWAATAPARAGSPPIDAAPAADASPAAPAASPAASVASDGAWNADGFWKLDEIADDLSSTASEAPSGAAERLASLEAELAALMAVSSAAACASTGELHHLGASPDKAMRFLDSLTPAEDAMVVDEKKMRRGLRSEGTPHALKDVMRTSKRYAKIRRALQGH